MGVKIGKHELAGVNKCKHSSNDKIPIVRDYLIIGDVCAFRQTSLRIGRVLQL